MSEMQHSGHVTSERERELELEVARLTAELDAASGADPVDATTRFLAMAAATVDRVVVEARREADELAHEISAAAEARRDEATRLAAEAETTAERLLAQADKAEQIVTEAQEQAESIRSAALEEADDLVAAERARMADERTTLTDVRESLELERHELEVYRAGLRSRVENLAQAMLAIMTTDLGPESRIAVENLLIPALQPVLDPDDEETDTPVVDDVETADHANEAAEALERPRVVEDTGVVESTVDDDTVGREDESGIDPETRDDDQKPSGLFARASEEEVTLPRRVGSLFGARGEWRVEQTSPEDLAEALAEEDRDDAAFEEFLSGDDAPDKSRDWLLRNESS